MDGSALPDLEMEAGTRCLSAGTVPVVAVLLSTWNGARFISSQLDSLLQQTDADWRLYWRDDGSDDDTAAAVRRFAAGQPPGRCTELVVPAGRLGVTQSFLLLLRTALDADPRTSWFAFADQDDVWLPDKLARGVASLGEAGLGQAGLGQAGLGKAGLGAGDLAGSVDRSPGLYCARQLLVDADLQRQGLSLPVRRAPGFPGSLTQNIATGCTVMLNRPAAQLVCRSAPPPLTIHDWWCYLLVSAAGGSVLFDDRPAVLYRQHGGNAVGAPSRWGRRALEALRRGPSGFMAVFRGHVGALKAQPGLLSPANRRIIDDLDSAMARGVLRRVACLRIAGLRRQTWQETLLFFWWFLWG
jgi:glycosyltransferase involved in cell wall biosynthesis